MGLLAHFDPISIHRIYLSNTQLAPSTESCGESCGPSELHRHDALATNRATRPPRQARCRQQTVDGANLGAFQEGNASGAQPRESSRSLEKERKLFSSGFAAFFRLFGWRKQGLLKG